MPSLLLTSAVHHHLIRIGSVPASLFSP
ncbi:hypothetical protein ABZ943_37650 [Streptomyces rubiginosohelvolus]